MTRNGKNIVFGALAAIALTMGASVDQAQAKGRCETKAKQGVPCGGIVVKTRELKAFTGPIQMTSTKCIYRNAMRYQAAGWKSWNVKEWLRCPGMTLEQSMQATLDFFK